MQNQRNYYRSKNTRHHKVPESKWGTSCEENIEYIRQTVHRAIHTIFENDLPHEQIKYIADLNKTTYTEEWEKLINDFKTQLDLLIREQKFYKKKCFKYWNYPKV